MWKRLSSKVLFKHPRLLVEEDEVEISSGEVIQYLRYGNLNDGVVIVASNDNNEILFNREYSYIPNRIMLQLPMGKIEEGEELVHAANRELQEETGYKAGTLVKRAAYYQNHRRSNNKGYVVLASDLVKSHNHPDLEEDDIKTTWISVSKIKEHIKNGDINDADTLSSLTLSNIL